MHTTKADSEIMTAIAAYESKFNISTAVTIYRLNPHQQWATTSNFYLRNLRGESQEEQVLHARQILDQVVQELHYLTGLGIDKGMIRVRSAKVVENIYGELSPRLEDSMVWALLFQFSPAYNYIWKQGQRSQRSISEDELGQGWQREVEFSRRNVSFQLPIIARPVREAVDERGERSFFLYASHLYRGRKWRGFTVKYDQSDPTFLRFVARFHEDGNLSFGERRVFASRDSSLKLEGRPWPKSKAKTQPQPRKSILASRPTDKTDYVYVIRALRTNLYKIGKTNDPEGRLQSLQTGSAHRLKLLHVIRADNATAAEEELHRLLHGKRMEGEWFRLTNSEKDVLVSIERFENKRFWINSRGLTAEQLF
jgi:hypothetical protein